MRVRLTNDSIAALTLFVYFLFNVSLSGSTIELNKPIGGVISTTSNTDQCIGDNQIDIVELDLEGNVGDSSLYALTTELGVIRVLQTSPEFDLTGAEAAVFKLVHISYNEFTVAPRIGINIKKLKGWFDLSNYVMVNRVSPFGGYLRSNDPSTVCVDDGIPDRIQIIVSAQRGDHEGWVVTDESGVIQQLIADAVFNLEGTGAGTFVVYSYASYGDQSVRVGRHLDSYEGCIDFSLPYEIIKETDCIDPCDLTPGIISYRPLIFDVVNATSICADDEMPDTIRVFDMRLPIEQPEQKQFIVFDEDGNILQINESPSIVISHTAPRICFIASIIYETELANFNVGNNITDIDGCYALSNFLELTKETDCEPPACIVIGGTIELEETGETTVTVCVDDGLNDNLQIQLLNNSGPSIWVVLDTEGVILQVQSEPIFNFEGGEVGTCRIRHLSLRDPITGFSIGENISDIEGCFSFSNSIFVNKIQDCAVQPCAVIGGIISANGQTAFTFCVDDGIGDLITPTVSNNVGQSNWVITDMTGMILMVSRDNMFNFEGSGEGVCQLWHVSSDDTEEGLDSGVNISEVVGCVSLSNPITITRQINCDSTICDVEGGSIVTTTNQTSVTICQDDDIEDVISVVLTGNTGPSTWLITDLNGGIVGIQNSPDFSLDNLNLNACRIWHMSLKDPLTGFGIGRNVSEIQGCYDLSNGITVTKQRDCGSQQCLVEGGNISFGGLTQFGYCVDDGLPDNLTASVTGNTGNSSWVVADTTGTILLIQNDSSFQFEGTQPGVCFIYHVSFLDPLSGFGIGQDIDLLSGCFDLSNPILITRDINCGTPMCNVLGGSISVSGLSSVTFCVDDDLDDSITVGLGGNSGLSSWLITDEEGNILLIQNSPSFNFEGVVAGVCQIWHISYMDNLVGFNVGLNVANVDGCFSLSNPITVTREEDCTTPVCNVDGGQISDNGQTELEFCISDNQKDVVFAQLSDNVGSSIWVVSDPSGVILQITNDTIIDLTGLDAGQCFIRHMSLEDSVNGLSVGQNINQITGCFDFSNAIQITKVIDCSTPVCDVMSGSISTGGETAVSVCLSDSESDIVNVDLTGNTGSSTWLVTDESGNIMMIQNDPSFDFANAGAGVCYIWHMSLQDPITGFAVGANVSDLGGCFAISNSIVVTRLVDCGAPVCEVLSGSISAGGETAVSVCLSDSESDVVNVDLTGNTGSSTWLVTDELGNILMIQNDPSFDFANAGAGVCYIWHMSLQDPITGFAVGANVSAIEGCFAISNSIVVTRLVDCGAPVCDVSAGSIATGGETAVSVCLSDSESDIVNVDLTGNTGSSTWLVTDELGNIMMIQNDPSFDFTNAGAGVCYIWHMSLLDPITGFAVGANVSDLGGCFAISNSIVVTRLVDCGAPVCDVQSGSISTGGETAVSVCLSDSESDVVNVDLTGNTGSSTWLVTDESGNILMIQNDPSFDFANAGAGVCYIWHMSLQDPITGFAVGANVSAIEGCFAISNSIVVTRLVDCGAPVCDVSAGSIATGGETAVSICLSDSESDIVNVDLTGNTGSSTWLVTDESGNIMMIQNDPNFDFANAGAGVCYIWHMSLQDPITGFAVGANVSDLGGCFAISNSIVVTRLVDCGAPVCDVTAGSIATGGETAVSVCLSDSESDIVNVDLTGNTGSSTWLVTDESGNIMMIQNDPNFDFANAGAGVCYIWHMSLQDPITGFAVGANVSEIGGCFAISNSIVVTRVADCGPPPCEGIIGGSISTQDGATSLTVCVDDGQAEAIEITLTGNTGPSTWVITDSDGNIADIQNTNIFSFEGVGAGVCFIYHLSLDNTLTGFTVGEPLANLAGCFQLSNRIQVNREVDCGPDPCNVNGGNIVSADGTADVIFCVDDGISDVVDIELTGNVGATTWVLTDGMGNILDIQSTPNFNFEGTPEGRCFIYHMSLQDPVTGFTLDGNLSDIQGCFSLSNSISVERVINCGPSTCMVDGGVIMTSDSMTNISVCVTDGVNEDIRVMVDNFNGARLWVVTNNVGEILIIQTEDVFNFEGVEAGTCFIYNIALRDPITGFNTGENLSAIQGCFDLSNPITVNRLEDCNTGPVASGGNIIGQGSSPDEEPSTSFTFCVDDNLPDMITITLTGNEGESTWVLTDSVGQILSVQATANFNFEGTGAGSCQIWHVASFGDLAGLVAGQNISNVTGNFALSNQIIVNRNVGCGPPPCDAVGGQITTINNQVALSVCIEDDVPDIVEVLLAGNSGNSSWVVANESGTILNIQTDRRFDFSSAGSGVCYIRHISSIDSLSNFEIGQNIDAISGCFQFSNEIIVTREVGCAPLTCDDIRSGSISVMNGLTEITVCIDDGMNENIIGEITGNVGGSIWIITDPAGEILEVENDAIFNFEGVNSGQCYIRHLGVLDPISGLIPGNNITDIMGCTQISNPVIVNRELCSTEPCVVSGGSIMTSDSLTAITLCVDDNVSDMFMATLAGATGISQWIITDSTGMVVGVQDGQNANFDFESSGAGMCQVWHLSTRDSSFNVSVGINVSTFEGCFSLSNPITVTRLSGNCAMTTCDDIASGSISLSDGSVATTVCIDDGLNESLAITQTGNLGAGLFVITDAQGIILDLENNPLLNFEGQEVGVCIVQYASLLEPFSGLTPGEALADVTGCVKISNTITVTRESCVEEVCEVNGGSITANSGETSLSICVDDQMPDMIDFNLTGAAGISTWLITDTSGVVLDVFDGETQDLEGADGGRCLIWHLAARDSSFNVVVGQNASMLEGCYALSNSIIVDRNVDCAVDSCNVIGGTISNDGGQTEVTICASDGISDAFEIIVSDNVGEFSVFAATDTTGQILGLQLEPFIDLEGTGPGVTIMYHISFRDSITGGEISQNINSLSGCASISNPLTITALENCGGTTCDLLAPSLSLAGSDTDVTVCTNDTIDDNLDVTLMAGSGDSSLWIITDTTGVILSLPQAPPFNFEGQAPGVCRIWNLTFSDSISGAVIGANASDIMGCISLSNSIQVTKINDCTTETCEASSATIALDNNQTITTVCADDGVEENLNVNLLNPGTGDSTLWLITDTLGMIIAVEAGPPFNFEGVDPGVCVIWNLNYNDAISGAVAGSNASDIIGCTALSNPIQVTRITECTTETCNATAGVIRVGENQTMTTVCVDDGEDENLEVIMAGGSGDSSLWLITDTLGVIISVPTGSPFNFEGIGPGLCQIWNVMFNDTLTGVDVGSNVSGIEGCFALSNAIQVSREIECSEQCIADGGQLTTIAGETSVTICSGDGFDDLVIFSVANSVGSNGIYLVTDTFGIIENILATDTFNFEMGGAGVSNIYHLAFIDSLGNVTERANISELVGCFDLSNPIRVEREINCTDCPAIGGNIVLEDGSVSDTLCVGDSQADIVNASVSASSAESIVWLATDTLGTILKRQDNGSFEFDDNDPGVCQIWHMSMIGTVTGVVIGDNVSGLDGCFDLSNPITIVKNLVDGGMVSTDSLDTELIICVGDSIRDVLTFVNTSESMLNYTYLVTDVDNRFLAISSGSIDIENIRVGMCRIYGVSHPGVAQEVFTIESQQDVTMTPIADCYDLSSNFIQLTRVSGDDCPDGGSLIEDGGLSFVAMGNPVRNELVLNIHSEYVEDHVWVEIRDVNGFLVFSEDIAEMGIGEMTKTIDVSELPNGLYYTTLRNNYNLQHKKIVIQR